MRTRRFKVIDWVEIHRLVHSEDANERKRLVEQLKNNFYDLKDKGQAWNYLIRLTQDTKGDVQWRAVDALGVCYFHLPEESKKPALEDLHRLTQDKNSRVRSGAANALGTCYFHFPEESKKPALEDLHRLTQDKNGRVRSGAANALGACYFHLSEESKKPALEDLHRLTHDINDRVRWCAADALVACYSHLPEEYRKQAWDDLIMLTQAKNDRVRWCAADALVACYSLLPEKYRKPALEDLHRLTQDKNGRVRRSAADALGACYSHLLEEYRKQAWDDLIMLTQDKDNDVRVAANHSSGRVSIFRAGRAKDDESVRKELETALEFFEKSSNEASYFNPANFCLPFYRSFYTITFRKEEAEAEVKQYLAEARKAVEGSESKDKLLEAVENLGNALNEVQKARDFDAIKSDLNAYRRYCDRACELLDTTEEKASGASRLIRKGLPIIDERIKGIIGEIKEKAKTLCKQTKGTQLEDLGKEANRHGQALLQIRDLIGLEKGINYMQITLSAICAKMPEEERGEACELLKKAGEEIYIEDKVYLINIILGKVSSQIGFQTILEELKHEIKARFDRIEKDTADIAQGNEVLRNLLIGYSNRTQGILFKLLDESKNSESKTQKLMKESFEEIIKNLEKRDHTWLEKFKGELIKNELEIEKEMSSVPFEIKSKWHDWIDYIKNKLEKETKEIIHKLPTEAVVLISTEKILEHGVPFLSAAITSPAALPSLILILYAIRGIVKDK